MTTQEKRDKAKALISEGVQVKDACARAGIHISTYYSKRHLVSKKPVKRAKAFLNVQDLPMTLPQGKLFMVYGSPEMLASFAKGLS